MCSSVYVVGAGGICVLCSFIRIICVMCMCLCVCSLVRACTMLSWVIISVLSFKSGLSISFFLWTVFPLQWTVYSLLHFSSSIFFFSFFCCCCCFFFLLSLCQSSVSCTWWNYVETVVMSCSLPCFLLSSMFSHSLQVCIPVYFMQNFSF